METPSASSRSKNKFLKISFNNLPFSPHRIKNRNKNKKVEEEGKKAHRKMKYELKNGGVEESLSGPASPTISCMGQIKHKKKRGQNINIYFQKEILPFSTPQAYHSKNKSSVIKPMFFLSEAEKIPSNMRNNGRNSDASTANRPVCLNQMKRFASCRDGALTNFDWKIARMEMDHLDEYFEEWKNDYQVDEEEFEEAEEEVVEVMGIHIPISAVPMAVVGGGGGGDDQEWKKRKEINIWQRRTIDKPMPLNIQRCH